MPLYGVGKELVLPMEMDTNASALRALLICSTTQHGAVLMNVSKTLLPLEMIKFTQGFYVCSLLNDKVRIEKINIILNIMGSVILNITGTFSLINDA